MRKDFGIKQYIVGYMIKKEMYIFKLEKMKNNYIPQHLGILNQKKQ